jgi:hypothetical protein
MGFFLKRRATARRNVVLRSLLAKTSALRAANKTLRRELRIQTRKCKRMALCVADLNSAAEMLDANVFMKIALGGAVERIEEAEDEYATMASDWLKMSAENDAVRANEDKLRCIVCWDRRSCRYFSCGHICMCEPCADSLDRCPKCRQTGAQTRLYFD